MGVLLSRYHRLCVGEGWPCYVQMSVKEGDEGALGNCECNSPSSAGFHLVLRYRMDRCMYSGAGDR